MCRHDEPQMRREYRGALVSCPGSFDVVPLPGVARQLELEGAEEGQGETAGTGDTLF